MIGIHRLVVLTDGKMLRKLGTDLTHRVVVVGAVRGRSVGWRGAKNAGMDALSMLL